MNVLIVVLLVLLVGLAAVILSKLLAARPSETLLQQQIMDLRNQLGETRSAQMRGQNEALRQQGEWLQQTQAVLSTQLGTILNGLNEHLGKSQANLNQQLEATGKVVHAIQTRLGALDETAREIREIGRDISSLQNILQAPKLRGGLGEYLLEDLLSQVFPATQFTMQYSFRDNTKVDAVIRLQNGMVPVDAKFPLESFQRLTAAATDEEKKRCKKEFVRSVKERINEIADKYIRPEEGTFDFALLYIPAENVFYEAVVRDEGEYEIFRHALGKRVIPVSPNSFYAYLTALVFGLQGLRIEQQARRIIAELAVVRDGFSRFQADFALVGKHIGNAAGKYEECARRAEKFQEKLTEVTALSTAREGEPPPPAVGPGL